MFGSETVPALTWKYLKVNGLKTEKELLQTFTGRRWYGGILLSPL